MYLSILLQLSGGAVNGQLIVLGLMMVVFYLFIIMPQNRKQKKQKAFTESIKRGDDVVTTSGMHGRVVSMDAHTVELEIDRGIKVTFEKAHISYELTEAVQKTAAAKKPALE